MLAADADPDAVAEVTRVAAQLPPQLSRDIADVVVSSVVLHFARDNAAFDAMLRESWRVLRNGGLFFARLASTSGMEGRVTPLGGRRHRLPDGTERYLVDEPVLMQYGRRLGGILLELLKTTVVQDQRCMTTWVMRKGA